MASQSAQASTAIDCSTERPAKLIHSALTKRKYIFRASMYCRGKVVAILAEMTLYATWLVYWFSKVCHQPFGPYEVWLGWARDQISS